MALPYLPQPQLNFPGPDLSPESNEGNVQVHDLATSARRMLPLCVLGKEDDEIVSSRVFSLKTLQDVPVVVYKHLGFGGWRLEVTSF